MKNKNHRSFLMKTTVSMSSGEVADEIYAIVDGPVRSYMAHVFESIFKYDLHKKPEALKNVYESFKELCANDGGFDTNG